MILFNTSGSVFHIQIIHLKFMPSGFFGIHDLLIIDKYDTSLTVTNKIYTHLALTRGYILVLYVQKHIQKIKFVHCSINIKHPTYIFKIYRFYLNSERIRDTSSLTKVRTIEHILPSSQLLLTLNSQNIFRYPKFKRIMTGIMNYLCRWVQIHFFVWISLTIRYQKITAAKQYTSTVFFFMAFLLLPLLCTCYKHALKTSIGN